MTSLTPARFHELLESPEARERHRKVRRQRFVGCLVVCTFAVVWNLIVYFALLFPLARGVSPKPLSIIAMVMLVIFGLIGLAALCMAVYALLSLFNPVAHAVLSPASPVLGQEFEIRWALDRHSRNIRRLQILLTGTEEAISRRGTDSTTSRNIFFTKTLLDTTDRGQMDGGTIRAAVPAASVPSFRGKSNAIIWAVQIKGEIPSWPDIDDAIPFEVSIQGTPA